MSTNGNVNPTRYTGNFKSKLEPRDFSSTPVRAGSEENLAFPSRVGRWLFYRDGRKVLVK